MEMFKTYPLMELEPVHANGCWITDNNKDQYLDFYGGHAVISIGHSHPHYVKSIKDQLDQIGYYSNAVKNSHQTRLAEKIGSMTGLNDYQLFLCNSGTESNEAALHLAYYHTGKSGILSFKNGFHGRTAGSASITSNPAIKGPKQKRENVFLAELDDIAEVESILNKEEIGAVVIECIQGIGGIKMANPNFYTELHALCDKHDVLLIADEVQSGAGRTGKFFSWQHLSSSLQPDLITMAKGMGNGFPVGGVLIAPQIKAEYGILGSTFGGNHLACCAAMSVLEVIEKESLLENAEHLGGYFMKEASNIPGVIEVRGRGLMIGLEFGSPVSALRKVLYEKYKVLTGSSSDPNVLRVLPPLTVSKDEIDIFLAAMLDIQKKPQQV
jgi:acetylornithine aminotransferase